jgi:Glycosyl hydrolases family 18
VWRLALFALAVVPFPGQVYAPYFETWSGDSLAATAQLSGARYFTLAFLEARSRTSCRLRWNGRDYLAELPLLRSFGGDVILSFGGWAADQGGTEIADSCKSVTALAGAYEDVVTKYDVSRLDMDIEGKSLRNRRGIDSRNKALKLVQKWAAGQRRPLEISYTLSTSVFGLTRRALNVLRNAAANGTRIDVINLMAFDYYDGRTADMGTAAIDAAAAVALQLRTLRSSAMVGITLMPGLDDAPSKRERTTLAHAEQVYDYALANGVQTLSIWSIQRDRGWAFSQVLAGA